MSEFDLKLSGIVLSSMPIGENDRRIVILTKERGKISAFARGARRPKSQLVAASNPFCLGTFLAFEGRDSYTIHSARITDYFPGVTGDIERVWYGFLMLEIAEFFALENADESVRLSLLYRGLKALSSERFNPELVRIIYQAKTTAIEGVYPDVFSCQVCGRKNSLSHFSFDGRGAVCQACAGKSVHSQPISQSAMYTLQFIFNTPPGKLFTFELKDETLQELNFFVSRYFRMIFDHEFKSEEFLDL